MNQINLVGRMTRDPEEFGTPPVGVRFSIATEDYDFSSKQRETEFHDCVAFGKTSEVINNYAEKGREVRVTGRIKSNRYTPTKGVHAGHEVEQKRVIVNDFELLAGKPKASEEQQPAGW